MKLNYKKTFYVGMAFFIISMFWQAYDTIVQKILVDKFGMNQGLSGFVMALDNILALFLLPLFGHLSDKTNTKLGKRTPYIIIGTILAAIFFVGTTFADNAQLANLEGITDNQYIWDSGILDEPSLKIEGVQIKEAMQQKGITEEYFIGLSPDSKVEKEIKDFNTYVKAARDAYAWRKTLTEPEPLIAFMVVLLLVLLSMSIFRSPAVALMPDVTIKPLRSKANAVINLMGAFGGIIVVALGMLFKTDIPSTYMSYTAYFGAVSAVMVLFLIFFLFKVNEKKLHQQYREDVIEYNIKEEDDEEEQSQSKHKMPKDKFCSLIFLLISVFMWFMAYNAVTSKFAVYSDKVLNFGFNLPLLAAQIAAIISFIPIGILASKIGRKKSIMVGVVTITLAFGAAYSITPNSTAYMYIIFVLAGLGWATINVNSYPMVVEMAKGSNIGKYTGFYYTASMAAQILTPILSGVIMDNTSLKILFPYAALFSLIALITMIFVKHGDNKPQVKKGLEAYDVPD